eukprot:TRINITY_DN15428_c0_g1_i1.p1 TRINITY_DN15428_c0_g1~~TRINITY_DN15428_c0_g1_i1.p1  ORF type:complete len:183 (+),score=45.99 TRINITY_DN15428_c0_g1_i1:71-550(+)
MEDSSSSDDFTRLRKSILTDIRNIHMQIDERGRKKDQTEDERMKIQLSIQELTQKVETMNSIVITQRSQFETARKTGYTIDPSTEQKLNLREEMVRLNFKHLEELEDWDKVKKKPKKLSGLTRRKTSKSQTDDALQVLLDHDKLVDDSESESSFPLLDM